MNSLPSTKEFYRGKTIFLTGATGYLGRFLVFKILKEFNVKRIFILLRAKGRKTFKDRVNEFKNVELFTTFLPDKSYLTKIVALEGDICQCNCGLNQEQQQTLRDQVEIVIHSAASIKFTASLKSSTRIHVIGTQNVIELAAKMTKVQVFTHVSSVSAWMNYDTVPENIPDDCHFDPLEISSQFQKLSDTECQQLECKYLGARPKFLNSYSFTKSLAELVVNQNKHRFKRVVIVRPPFLISSHAEPLTGWFDEPQEGVSLGALGSFGLCRIAGLNAHQAIDVLPVDVCVNGLLAITWYMGVKEKERPLKVFNLSIINIGKCTVYDMLPAAIQFGYKYPSIRQLRPPIDLMHYQPTKTFVSVKSFFTHTLFSILIDFILIMFARKPMLYELTKKKISAIDKIFQALGNYKQEFKCETKNINLIYGDEGALSSDDRETLFYDLNRINWYRIAENGHLNFRRRVLKESDETLAFARKRLFYISIIYKLVTFAFQVSLFYVTFKLCAIILFYLGFLWPLGVAAIFYCIFELFLNIDESAFTLTPRACDK